VSIVSLMTTPDHNMKRENTLTVKEMGKNQTLIRSCILIPNCVASDDLDNMKRASDAQWKET
jgi:hypothetical protein